MRRRFRSVNVFSESPLGGNPVAVVLDSEDLDTEEMLAFTQWTNLSEATFVLPPTTADADYRVRIFTLEREMPFAGHPTLGTCHAWLEAGGQPRSNERIVQECGAGLVPIRSDRSILWFEAPALIRDEPVTDADIAALQRVLGLSREQIIDAHWLDNGPGWVVLLLDSVETLLDVRVQPTSDRLDVGLVALHDEGHDTAVEVRALFTDHNIVREDPVTGSLNAGIAQWMFRTNRTAPAYVASQGQRLGRSGSVHLELNSTETVWIGGTTTTLMDGHVQL